MTFSDANTSPDSRPLISICVPTFNRESCLENLLKNLDAIKTAFGPDVEICISNNHSTDNTSQVIDKWSTKLALKTVTQPTNIGATRNVIEVTRSATGRWILIIGDDDELIPQHFKKLLNLLQTADEGDWILAGVADGAGSECLLGDLRPGRHEANSFRWTVLRTGLFPFGFVGMHIFPSTLRTQFVNLSSEQAQPWPHIALFLRHLRGGPVRIFPDPVVSQAAGGGELYWHLGDGVHIYLRQLNIIAEARKHLNDHRLFFDALILRQLYSLRDARGLVLWKALEPEDFYPKAFREYIVRYALLGPLAFLAVIHLMFLLTAYATPSSVMRAILRLVGKGQLIAFHIAEKQARGHFDGVKRGL